jgi:hypothetical protein
MGQNEFAPVTPGEDGLRPEESGSKVRTENRTRLKITRG